MKEGKSVGRALAQSGVITAAQMAHRRIEADESLTEVQKFWAHLGVAALQVGGHVAVNAIADWAEEND